MAGVLDVLASYIQNMLMQTVAEEVHMLLGVFGEINDMGIKLGDLKNFLADTDRRNITDQSVQAWVRELRNAMYDATDILDLCQLKAMERGPRHDAGCFNPLVFCIRNPLHAHDIGSRIKNLNKKLDGIKARSESFNFINLGTYDEDRGKKRVPDAPRTHETSSGLDESSLVGEKIEEDMQNLVEMLTKEDQTHRLYNKIRVFTIVGVGGIGKTTLARKIFNNDIVQQEFSKKIWLSVNQDFNELDILRRAIIAAGGDYHVAGDTKETLELILTQAMKRNKTLMIMDDVWEYYHAWEDVLRTPLANIATANNCIRVLITTRHNTVVRGTMAEEPYHRIRKLVPEDAWLLLKKQVVVNIGLLRHLRHLRITRTSINTIPRGFCGLTCMRNLYGFPANIDGDWCSLEELGPVSQLMNLSIRFLENVTSASFVTQARLGKKNHLRYLSMNCTTRFGIDGFMVKVGGGISEEERRRIEEVFDELFPPSCLETLDIRWG